MSHNSNTELLERAAELIDELSSHPAGLDKRLATAVEANDLDELRYQVAVCESVLAQEAFHEFNILDGRDEY